MYCVRVWDKFLRRFYVFFVKGSYRCHYEFSDPKNTLYYCSFSSSSGILLFTTAGQ